MKYFTFSKWHIVLCLLMSVYFADAQIYVNHNATGANNGTSWTDAYTNLQTAIDAATIGQEIWVSSGTYKPSAYPLGCIGCNSNRDYVFSLKNGVMLYGGFSGTETAVNQRIFYTQGLQNETVLSGDIGIVGDTIDNCFHVVLASLHSGDTTHINGFSIVNGNANDFSTTITVNGNQISKRRGGGIYTYGGTTLIEDNRIYSNFGATGGGICAMYSTNKINSSSIYDNLSVYGGAFTGLTDSSTVSNNAFYNNTSIYGGGIYVNNQSITTIQNNNIHNNLGTYGGGIYLATNTAKVLLNSIFNNTSTYGGGAIYIFDGTNNIINNTIYNNSAPSGGGIYSLNGGNVFLQNIVHNNTSISGGGISADNSSNQFTENRIYDNTSNNGGGIYVTGGISKLSTNFIYNNSAINGGGLYLNQSTDTINNNVIYDNTSDYGGGVRLNNGNYVFLNNITFHNTAFLFGGGILLDGGTNIVTANKVYDNTVINYGGGIYANMGDNTYTNNTIYSNTSSYQGGGMYLYQGNNILNKNHIYDNTATHSAGGIMLTQSTSTIQNNVIEANNTSYAGGGIAINQGVATVINNVIHKNHSDSYASAIAAIQCQYAVINNTIVANNVGLTGETISNSDATGTFTNNLFWDNAKGGNTEVEGTDIVNYNGTVTVQYCLTQKNSLYSSGNGIINNQDPNFVDATNGNFRVNIGSPVVDAGIDTANSLLKDIVDNDRIQGSAIDLGAFESDFVSSTLFTSIKETNISIYPNPVRDILTIENGEGQATIYNAIGQPVHQVQITNSTQQVNMSDLPKGIYFLRIEKSNGKIVAQQLIK